MQGILSNLDVYTRNMEGKVSGMTDKLRNIITVFEKNLEEFGEVGQAPWK